MTNNSQRLHTDKLSDQVYAIIKERIINDQYKPGSRLDFVLLQREFQISKTPLREALHRLELEKFVQVQPRSGTYVSIPNLKDVTELFDLRKAIEWQAVQLSVKHLPSPLLQSLQEEITDAEEMAKHGDYTLFFQSDANLHQAIFNYAHNAHLQRIKDNIDSHLQWYRIIGATKLGRILNSSARHQQILGAIMDRDGKRARDLMEIHVEEVKLDMIQDFCEVNNV